MTIPIMLIIENVQNYFVSRGDAQYGHQLKNQISPKRGGVQLHFCTWPPDFCQMYMYKMYKNVQKCTK